MSIIEKSGDKALFLGLHKEATPILLDAMRVLLADTATVSQAVHGFHWNVKGPDFAQYHGLFGGVYEDLNESIDPTAEALLKLGVDAPGTLGEFVALRSVQDPAPVPSRPEVMAAVLVDMLNGLLRSLNVAFMQASAANEQGVANFLSDRIDHVQKHLWQLRVSAGSQA